MNKIQITHDNGAKYQLQHHLQQPNLLSWAMFWFWYDKFLLDFDIFDLRSLFDWPIGAKIQKYLFEITKTGILHLSCLSEW